MQNKTGISMSQLQKIQSGIKPLQPEHAQRILNEVNKYKALAQKENKSLLTYFNLSYKYDNTILDENGNAMQYPSVLRIRIDKEYEPNDKLQTLFKIDLSKTIKKQKDELTGEWSDVKDENNQPVYWNDFDAGRYWEKGFGEVRVNADGKETQTRRKHLVFHKLMENIEEVIKLIPSIPPKEKGRSEATPTLWSNGYWKFDSMLREQYLKQKEQKELETPTATVEKKSKEVKEEEISPTAMEEFDFN